MAFITPKTFLVNDILTAVDMNVFVRDNTNALKNILDTGFRFAGRRVYSSAGTHAFAKADPFGDGSFSGFPARALRVIAIGGGGAGGGGASTGTSQASVASGGGSGGYSESIITSVDLLAASVSVVVGAGGTGSLGGSGADGVASDFAATGANRVLGIKGRGGDRTSAITGVVISGNTIRDVSTAFGQITNAGQPGNGAIFNTALFGAGGSLAGGSGGNGPFASGGAGISSTTGATAGDGQGFGAGGGGVSVVSPSSSAATGRPGSSGAVIIDVFI